jgi:thymidylate synthase (FAD)
MKIVEPSARLIWATPIAEKMIEVAGRTCYKSEPKVFADCKDCNGTGRVPAHKDIHNDKFDIPAHDCKNCYARSSREFIQKIIKSGHHSVLEHSSASLKIITDNGIMREITRHRLFSYSIESTRYCNYSKDKFDKEITVIKPSQLIEEHSSGETGSQATTFEAWEISCMTAENCYLDLIRKNISPQVARSVLPLCTKCEIVMTGNFRSWRNFLKLRLDKAAHPDMIVVAKMVCRELKKVAPTVFEEYECEN